MEWTDEQVSVFDEVKGRSHVIIDAVAGSGKTSTIVEAMKRCSGRSCFVAFNAAIAKELKDRGCKASTLHSMALRALSRAFRSIDVDADDKHMSSFFFSAMRERKVSRERFRTVLRMATALTRSVLSGNRSLDSIDRYLAGEAEAFVDVFGDELLVDCARIGADMCRVVADTASKYIHSYDSFAGGLVTFDLMLYLADKAMNEHRFEGASLSGGADTVFVDEAQDLNPVQHSMVRHMAVRSKVVAVGDVGQAIYMWRGASSDSIPMLRSALGRSLHGVADRFLSRCFRCPRSHVELAATVRPGIVCGRTDGVEGEITRTTNPLDGLKNGDTSTLIVSRTRAAAVKAATMLIRRRIRFAGKLKAVIGTAVRTVSEVGEDKPLDEAIESVRNTIMASMPAEDEDNVTVKPTTSVETLEILDALMTSYVPAGSGNPTVADFVRYVDGIIDDATKPSQIVVSTVHGAKGLEASNVHLLEYDRMPLCWPGQSAEEAQQERNVLYVGLTRAKKRLVLGVSA